MTRAWWIALSLVVACSEATELEEYLGAAEVAIATVPGGVKCIHLVATGAAEVVKVSKTTSAGASSEKIAVGALSPGAVTLVGTAYNTACPSARLEA